MAEPKWKKFEQDIQDYLKKREEKEPLTYHRFYDTASAGDFLPAQPGDFLIISRGMPILLEAKHSTVHKTLKACFSSAVKNSQIGFHRVWQRAGTTTFFIFKSEIAGEPPVIELWDGKQLVRARQNHKRLSSLWIVKTGNTLQEVLSDLYLNITKERILLL